jgi:hypothetical protein
MRFIILVLALLALALPAVADDNYHTATDATSLDNCAGSYSETTGTNFGRCPGIPWMFWFPEFKGYERRAQEGNAAYQGTDAGAGVSAAPSVSVSPSISTGGYNR